MADIVINTKVESPDLSPLQSLNKELKAAKAAALNGDGKAAQRVAELKDKMDDLKDATRSLQGSGVEKLKNSFSLLTEGFRNFDGDKISTSFKGIGTAMKAIPIFLIVEGISYLVENFKELSQGSGILAKTLRFVGDIITGVKDAVYELTDAIGLTNSELDKQGEAIKEAVDTTSAAFDRQIKVAAAAGKSTVELEKAKQEAIVKTNLAVVKQIEAFVRAGGELSDEQKKILTASLENIRNAKTEETVVSLKGETEKNKALQGEYKKHQDELNKIRKDAQQEILKGEEQERANLLEFNQLQAKEKKDAEDKALADKMAQDDADIAAYQQRQKDVAAFDEKQRKDKEEQDKLLLERKAQAEANYFAAASSLADTYFALQIANAEGNEKRQNELRKKAFQVDKALKASQATIDGIKAVNATIAQGGAFALPLAISIGVLAFANVAKILATKFDDKGGSSGSSAPNISGGSTPSNVPTSQPIPQSITQPQQTTTFDAQGNKTSGEVVVRVSEINDTQRKVARVKEQATF